MRKLAEEDRSESTPTNCLSKLRFFPRAWRSSFLDASYFAFCSAAGASFDMIVGMRAERQDDWAR